MELSKVNSILIINLGGIGDLVLSTGAVKLLRKKYERARMDILVVDRAGDLMRSYSLFNNVYSLSGFHDLGRLAGLFVSLRKNRYDLVLNMRTIVSWSSALKMFLVFKTINGKIAAGRDTEGKGFFYDVKVPETYLAEKLEHEYDVELIQKLGIDIQGLDISVPVSPSDREYAASLLERNNIRGSDLIIGINPGGQPSRRWPAESFAQLINKILEGIDCRIILVGSVSEQGLCKSIVNAVNNRNVHDLSGATNINQLSALISRFRLFVSNDTSTMHIAVAAGTPGVFIFGPGNPTRFAPFKNRDRYILLHKPTECAPCEDFYCSRITCLKKITPDEVYAALTEIKRRTDA